MFRWRRNISEFLSARLRIGGWGGVEGRYAACVVGSAWGCYALSPSRVLIPAQRPLREWVTAVSHRIAEFSDGPLRRAPFVSSRSISISLPNLGSPRESLCIFRCWSPRRGRGAATGINTRHASRTLITDNISDVERERKRERRKESTDCPFIVH